MAKTTGASNTQKMLLLSLAEGWRLRSTPTQGWCLFQSGRERPFARVKDSSVDHMTKSGWLSAGIATKQLGFLPEKLLTASGRKYAQKLIDKCWAEDYEWDPNPIAGSIDSSSTVRGSLAA